MEIDKVSKKILERSGIEYSDSILIPREKLLDENNVLYNELKEEIQELKKIFSSSALTSLQQNAETRQKWPLLNLVRQILHVYGYKMKPIRKSNGYTKDGMKKFIRFFLITKN